MILTPRPHRLARNPDHVISVKSNPISEVHSFRFLGVTLSNNLTWKSNIESIRCKLRSCLGIIYKARDCLNTSCLLSIDELQLTSFSRQKHWTAKRASFFHSVHALFYLFN